MNTNRVKEILEYVKGSPESMNYGKWGTLNQEQRQIIKELCNSWLILDEATNIQTKEIERLNNIIKEVREYIENNKQYVELEDYGKNGEYYIDETGILEILDKVGDEK